MINKFTSEILPIARNIVLELGRVLDPRRDHDNEAPRAAVAAKKSVEYFFKVSGYFLLLCLIVGMTLTSCPDNVFLAYLPLLSGVLFFFYILLTTIGIPIFGLLGLIKHTLLRRLLTWATVVAMLWATNIFLEGAPVLDLLVVYVSKLFPTASECATNPIKISSLGL